MKYCYAFGYILLHFCSFLLNYLHFFPSLSFVLHRIWMCVICVFSSFSVVDARSLRLHCIALHSDAQIQFFIHINVLALITRIEIHRCNLMIAVASEFSYNVLQEKLRINRGSNITVQFATVENGHTHTAAMEMQKMKNRTHRPISIIQMATSE